MDLRAIYLYANMNLRPGHGIEGSGGFDRCDLELRARGGALGEQCGRPDYTQDYTLNDIHIDSYEFTPEKDPEIMRTAVIEFLNHNVPSNLRRGAKGIHRELDR